MLKIKDSVDLKELDKYMSLICRSCFIDDKLNTYRYRLKNSTDEIEITNKKIHYGNSECIWFENIYDLIKDGLIEKVEDYNMDNRTLEEVRNNETKLINKIEVLEQQRQKAVEYIKNYQDEWYEYDEVVSDMRELLEILED